MSDGRAGAVGDAAPGDVVNVEVGVVKVFAKEEEELDEGRTS
jgi:hypothetical protein